MITPEQLETYIKSYLDTYYEGVGNMGDSHKDLFDFHKEIPKRCVGLLSASHGAAVAFYQNEKEIIEIKIIKERIEDIFPKDPNTDDTLLCTRLSAGVNVFKSKIWILTANLHIQGHFLQKSNELVIFKKGYKLSVDENGTYEIEDKLILKGNNNISSWSKEQAIKDAFFAITRILINKKQKNKLSSTTSNDQIDNFSQKINRFKSMINDSGIGEPELQLFFEENPEFLFHGLANNYKDYFPHIVLKSNGNDDLIPDFILKRTTDDYYDILDIKLPDKTLIVGQKNRRKYSSEVESAIAQVREYREYFNDPSNRQYIEDKYGIAVLKPNIIVLIGKDIYPEERLKVNEIYSSEIEIFTYDQMVKCLEKFLLELEKYKF